MNPQSETNFPTQAGNPKSEGRPRALNDLKRRQICDLTAEGLNLQQAARHVQCSTRTIRREMRRNPEFGDEVRRNENFAQINPLSALQRAVHHNWRAAAWLLERLFPDRFARKPRTSAFGKRQVRQLLDEVLQIVRDDLIDTSHRERIDGRIRAAFEYRMHVYCKPKRSSVGLRQAIEWIERGDKQRGPLDEFSYPVPDLSVNLNPATAPTPDAQVKQPKPRTFRSRQENQELANLSEVVRCLLDELSTKPEFAPAADITQAATSRDQKSPDLSPSVDKTFDAECST